MMMRTFVVEKTKSILILIAFIITISNAIIQLDPTSFAKEQQSERILLILMHDGNLERLKPLVDNFVKAESLLQLKGVSSGTFDCSAFPDFATDLAIDRLPVILAFRNYTLLDSFKGKVTGGELLKFVLKHIPQPPKTEAINNSSTIQNKTETSTSTTQKSETKEGEQQQQQQPIEKTITENHFHAPNAELKSEIEALTQSTALKPRNSNFPIVEEISGNNVQTFIAKKKPLFIYWSEIDNEEQALKLSEWLSPLSERFSEKLTLVFGNSMKNQRQMAQFGLTGKSPALTIFDPFKFIHYGTESVGINMEIIVEFIMSYSSGTLKPNMKSEPIPDLESEKLQSVKTVVFDNFGDFVMRAQQPVVVLFYRSSELICEGENCVNSVGIFNSLAKEFLANETFMLAHPNFLFTKIDLDKNDTPRHSIYSVIAKSPAVKLFSVEDKIPITFPSQSQFSIDFLRSWLFQVTDKNPVKERQRNVLKDVFVHN